MNTLSPLRLLLVFVAGAFSPALARAGSPGFDEPLKVIQTTDAEFPLNNETRLLHRGQVRVVVNIDSDGRLADWLVASYTHRDFADAAVQALKEWRYEPARQHGEPVGTRASLVFDFEIKGQVISMNSVESLTSIINTATAGSQAIERVCLPRELDRPLEAVQTVAPRTVGARTLAEPRRITVDFFIDETGRPRMPVVEDARDSQAAAAVDALMQWRYSGPTRAGEPVAVRARQIFVFARNP
ncbi:MAG TPA: TonB family protein [Opitutaceae bacterium]|nr:TonB family protein [Opitutaceae bacterium]